MADKESHDASRGYGKPGVMWLGTTSRFFPPDEPLSASVAAYFVRMDELRFLNARIYQITRRDHDEASPRMNLRDEQIEQTICWRYTMICIEDADKHLDHLNRDSRFRSSLQELGLLDGWTEQRKIVKQSEAEWRSLRKKSAAHIDYDVMQRGLQNDRGGLSKVWMGRSFVDFSFEPAHSALVAGMANLNGRSSSETELDFLTRMIIKAGDASSAMFQILQYTLQAFDNITKVFFKR